MTGCAEFGGGFSSGDCFLSISLTCTCCLVPCLLPIPWDSLAGVVPCWCSCRSGDSDSLEGFKLLIDSIAGF
jgi:hypothetical protein